MMNYEEACEYMKSASQRGSILGLENIENLMDALGNIQNKLDIIHIAGTNGKGSVGAYLASIFSEAGLKVARYTSPAVFDPLEIMTFDGKNISQEEYAKAMSQVKDACDIVVSRKMPKPTAFEIETALAFIYFYDKQPDIVLLETGMGGRLDATNVIMNPVASVITSISMDHMGFLGDTIEKIATEKAGIIKEGSKVFTTVQQDKVTKVLKEKAAELKCDFEQVEDKNLSIASSKVHKLKFMYNISGNEIEFETSMAGQYQMYNAALAINVAGEILTKYIGFSSEKKVMCIHEGIKKAKWWGRFEVISENPLFILDGAHNEGAAEQLALTVKKCFTNAKLTYIIGVLADKEHEKILKIMLPMADKVFAVTPDNPRALDGEMLAKEAVKYHSNVEKCDSIQEAVEKAIKINNPIIAFGSLSYLGELRTIACRISEGK